MFAGNSRNLMLSIEQDDRSDKTLIYNSRNLMFSIEEADYWKKQPISTTVEI